MESTCQALVDSYHFVEDAPPMPLVNCCMFAWQVLSVESTCHNFVYTFCLAYAAAATYLLLFVHIFVLIVDICVEVFGIVLVIAVLTLLTSPTTLWPLALLSALLPSLSL